MNIAINAQKLSHLNGLVKRLNLSISLIVYRVGRLKKSLCLILNKHQQRRQLGTLTEDRLNDLGISKEDALSESRLPCWK